MQSVQRRPHSTAQGTNPQNWGDAPSDWSEVPLELWKVIFKHTHSFSALSSCALVCKQWRVIITHNSMGVEFLQRAGLVADEPNSWMPLYRDFTSTPFIIALDVSSSMGDTDDEETLSRMAIAREDIKKLLDRLSGPLTHRGIDCIVSSNITIRRKFHNAEDAIKFFSGGYEEQGEQNEEDALDGTTCINKLFNKLIVLQHTYQTSLPELRCNATVISDFDDNEMSLRCLETVSMDVQCLNVGSFTGETALEDLKDDYEHSIKKQAREKRFIARQNRNERSTDRGQRQRPQYSTTNPRRQRLHSEAFPEASPPVEYIAPLTFSSVQIDDWQVRPKRRKITLT